MLPDTNHSSSIEYKEVGNTIGISVNSLHREYYIDRNARTKRLHEITRLIRKAVYNVA